jgi:glycosyltransferase involved in cell wall biosynthesis
MVVHAYYPIGETRVEREALALVAHGYEVDVICLRSPSQRERDIVDGVQVHRLPVRRLKYRGGGLIAQLFEYLIFFARAFIHLTALHRQRHYNVVQVHNLPDFLVFAAIIPKLTGARIILDLHDLMPEFYAERCQLPLDSLLVRLVSWQEQIACRFADQVITVTELWRQTLIERGQPADKVTVVMNVADDRIFRRDAAPDRLCDDGCFRLIYHGTLAQRYGIDLILRAVNIIRQTIPNVRLTLHGGGEYREVLISLVDELGLQDHVQLSLRYVPTVELPRLLKVADLAIVPYRNGVFTSGILPTKLMEYAALGIPAIVARTPAIKYYFDDSMVEFFEPGDVDNLVHCICSLYGSPGRLAELVQGSKKFSQRYNWATISAQYVALVDRLSTRQATSWPGAAR